MKAAFLSAKELAGLPGLPNTAYGIAKRAVAQCWAYIEVPAACRGGKRREYAVASLPEATRKALMARGDHFAGAGKMVESVGQVGPAEQVQQKEEQSTAHLKHWQRATMDARLALLREVERRAVYVGANKAVESLVDDAKRGALAPALAAVIPEANARGGKSGSRSVSRSSIFAWRSAWAEGGLIALAPKDVEKAEMPDWAPVVLEYYQRPQKPSVPQALEWLARDLGEPGSRVLTPSKYQVRRLLNKMSRIDREKGRLSRAEMGRITWYFDRDTGTSEPFTLGLCDGHSAKFRVQNPRTGKPFHPELCSVIDAVSRYCAGWSAGLSESAWTVGEAVIHAATVNEAKPLGGIFAMIYTDLGSGNKAHQNAAEVTGLFARLGTTPLTGLPNHPRGRGRIERVQASLWIRAGKELAAYTGKDVNADHARRVYLTTLKDIKAKGESSLVLKWSAFLDFAARAVDEYNRRPHSKLPKITDPVTGLRRHLSPLEALQGWMGRGWKPVYPDAEELKELPRPMQKVTIRNGMFSLFGNRYGDPCLDHYHDMECLASVDWHDAASARVYDLEHRYLCEAKFEANKQRFVPESLEEQSLRKREKTREAAALRKLADIRDERRGTFRAIEVTAEEIATADRMASDLAERQALRAEEEAARLSASNLYTLPQQAPEPLTDAERWEQCRDKIGAGAATDEEREFVRLFEARMFREAEG